MLPLERSAPTFFIYMWMTLVGAPSVRMVKLREKRQVSPMCLHRIWTAWRSRESILPEVMDVRFAHLHGHPSKPGFIRGIPLLTVMIRIMPRRRSVRMTLPWVMHLPRLVMLPDIGESGDMEDPRICKIRLSIMCRLSPLLTDICLLSRNSIMYVPIPFFSQPFGMHLRNEG